MSRKKKNAEVKPLKKRQNSALFWHLRLGKQTGEHNPIQLDGELLVGDGAAVFHPIVEHLQMSADQIGDVQLGVFGIVDAHQRQGAQALLQTFAAAHLKHRLAKGTAQHVGDLTVGAQVVQNVQQHGVGLGHILLLQRIAPEGGIYLFKTFKENVLDILQNGIHRIVL